LRQNHLQPWHFTVITDPDTKRRIREAAEVEECDFYNGRAPQEWLDALAPLGTYEHKGFLETAPVLIAILGQRSSEARRYQRPRATTR
jgi:iodotyrosine deiodinase